MRPELILLFAGMGAINYAVRAAGMLVGELLPKEGRLAAALTQLPAAILISLVAPLLLHGGGAEWAGAAIVAAIASRSEGLLLPLAAGVVAVALLRLI
ncbi:MAG TPA: AzlD domain-containing protein [Stellaceae bacterium]|nr:AzlD domain-containing protein [Stellaceae bacterium]